MRHVFLTTIFAATAAAAIVIPAQAAPALSTACLDEIKMTDNQMSDNGIVLSNPDRQQDGTISLRDAAITACNGDGTTVGSSAIVALQQRLGLRAFGSAAPHVLQKAETLARPTTNVFDGN